MALARVLVGHALACPDHKGVRACHIHVAHPEHLARRNPLPSCYITFSLTTFVPNPF